MATRKRIKQETPLIIENHADDYTGLPFITLLQFCHDHVLTLVDNANEKTIKAYVLDLCGPGGVDEEVILSVAADWYENNRDNYPLSIEFSKRGLSQSVTPVYKTYNIEYVTRVIGPLPSFNMKNNVTVRRRRKKTISPSVKQNVYQLTRKD